MIVIRNEEKEVVEVFDTAKEFKEYFMSYLIETENGMKQDKIIKDNEFILGCDIRNASFNIQLNHYLDLTEDEIEFK